MVIAGGGLPDAAIVSTLGVRGPQFFQALQRAEGDAARIPIWLDIGDALIAMGRWDRARMAWDRGLRIAEARLETRTQAGSFYWRFGQLAEGLRELADAATWFERAADVFHKEGAVDDEVAARMALTRIVFHMRGAGEARQHARDAVLLARDAGDEVRATLFGETLELAAEVALDLGHYDEALAAFRDAARQHERARVGQGGETRSEDEVRALVALAEVQLESGQAMAALATYEAVESYVESHESLEIRGRGMAFLALVNLELGRIAEAAEPLEKAHEWLDAAGSALRRARLFVATARRIERIAPIEDAQKLYEKAWVLGQEAGDELRLAPIGYALARCFAQMGDWVRADDVIGKALTFVQNAGDIEGLQKCTELGVRIAIKLAQGRLAVDRLLLLARTRGRIGDRLGEVRSLRAALAAVLAVPGLEAAPVIDEFMEGVRTAGTLALGPAEVMDAAESLAAAKRPREAMELALMEAERHLQDDRKSDAARTFSRAAVWAIQAHDRWAAVDHWDRAIALGHDLALPEVEHWKVERAIAFEG